MGDGACREDVPRDPRASETWIVTETEWMKSRQIDFWADGSLAFRCIRLRFQIAAARLSVSRTTRPFPIHNRLKRKAAIINGIAAHPVPRSSILSSPHLV